MRNGRLARHDEGEIVYPESDGRPMAETDDHRFQMNYLLEALDLWFGRRKRVYVAGNNLIYCQQGDPRLRLSPDTYVVKGVEKRRRRAEEGKRREAEGRRREAEARRRAEAARDALRAELDRVRRSR